jgi:hypothetical protein
LLVGVHVCQEQNTFFSPAQAQGRAAEAWARFFSASDLQEDRLRAERRIYAAEREIPAYNLGLPEAAA